MGYREALVTDSLDPPHGPRKGEILMTYNLRNGYSVITRKAEGGTEFETRNQQGATISTVTLGYVDANALVRKLFQGRV
jgi:hypothetical protein